MTTPLPVIPDWKNYDPQTGVGDPSTPLTATTLNAWRDAIQARTQAAVDAADEAAAQAGMLADDRVSELISTNGTDTQTALGAFTDERVRFASDGLVPNVGGAVSALPLSGSAWVATPGARSVTLAPPAGVSNAFPAITLCADRSLLAIWRTGPGHGISLLGHLVVSRSHDFGQSWTTPTELFPDTAADQRDPSLTRLSDGDLALTYFKSAGSSVVESVIRFSRDAGDSWTAERALSFGFSTPPAVNGVIETPTGILIANAYGTRPSESTTSTQVIHSSDGGVTWGSPVTIAPSATDGRPYNESALAVLPGGALLALVRSDNGSGGGIGAGIYRTVSTDGGHTWSPRTRVIDGWGRPAVLRTRAGFLIAAYRRFGGQREHLVATSLDDGLTWSTPVPLHPFDAETTQSVYSQMVELSTNLIGVAFSDEITGANGQTRFKYLQSGVGITPLGDSRLAPERVFLSANDLWPTASTAPTANTLGSQQRVWQFADGATQSISGYTQVPGTWSAFDVYAVWAPSSTNTGAAKIDGAYQWIADGAVLGTGTYVAAPAVAASGTANAVQRSKIIAGLTRTTDDPIALRAVRLGADAGDSYTGAVQLLGLELVKTA